jgi:predicted component of type VI protein secretion system
VFIIVSGGELSGQRFEVGEELTVGRENSDLTLPDTEASRHHAVLRAVDGGIEVEDLHSLNGTWVGGERLERPVTLGDGAELRIGMTTLRVEAPIPAPAPTRLSAAPGAQPTEAHAPGPQPRSAPPRSAPPPSAPPAPSAPPPLMAEVPLHAPVREVHHPTPEFAARARGGVATRLWLPAAMTFAIVIATAVALMVYFATR